MIDSFTISENITEKTTGTIPFFVEAHDIISGLDHDNCTYQWGYGAPQSAPQPLVWDGERFSGSISDDWNVTQGSTLNIYATVLDIVGYARAGMLSEYIDPVNDPPEFTMSLASDPYESEFVGITFEGADPDGEGVGFDIQYNIQGANSSTWVNATGDALVSLDSRHFKLQIGIGLDEGLSHSQMIFDCPTSLVSKMIRIDPKSIDPFQIVGSLCVIKHGHSALLLHHGESPSDEEGFSCPRISEDLACMA